MGRKKIKKKIKKKVKIYKAKRTQEKAAFDQSNKQTYYKSKTFKANEIKIKKILKQPVEKKKLQGERFCGLSKTWSGENSFYRKSKNRKY